MIGQFISFFTSLARLTSFVYLRGNSKFVYSLIIFRAQCDFGKVRKARPSRLTAILFG